MLVIVGGEDRDGCEGAMNRSQGVKEFAVVSFFHVMLCPRQEMPQRLEEKNGDTSGIFREFVRDISPFPNVAFAACPPCLGTSLPGASTRVWTVLQS